MKSPFSEIHKDIAETKNSVEDIKNALPDIQERQYAHGHRLRKYEDQLEGQYEHLSRLQRTVIDVAESRRFTYIPKPYFQPRTGLWEVFDRSLSKEGPTLPVVLVGLGGMGKTSVATEWTNKQKTSGKYHSIRRMLMDKLSMESSLYDLAHDLYIETDNREREDWLRDIAQRFQAQSWLMLWDNVDSYSAIEEILSYFTSTTSTQQLLITSRDTTGWQDPIMVDTFTPDESIAYIQHQMTAAGSPWFKREQAEKLAECFDHHPLALELAMGTVCLYQRPLEQYLKTLENAGFSTLKAPDKKLASQARINTNRLGTLWQMGLANLPGDAIALLQLMSFIDVGGVGRDLMEHYFGNDSERCDEALLALRQQAFIKPVPSDTLEIWGTHRLLQEVVREDLVKIFAQDWGVWEAFLKQGWAAIQDVFPLEIHRANDTAAITRAVIHGHAFLKHIDVITGDWPTEMSKLALWSWQAWVLMRVGQGERTMAHYTTALDCFNQMLIIYRRIHEENSNHPDIANGLKCLGLVHQALGNTSRAIELCEDALKMLLLFYSTRPNHPDIAITLNVLGGVHQAQGNQQRAIEFCEASLIMHRLVYAKTLNDPSIAKTLNNLGAAYLAQGNYPQAIAFFEETLVMYRLIYATMTNHPQIAAVLNNLGAAYKAQGNYPQAIARYEESLVMNRFIYATVPNQPVIATALNNLGDTYLTQGNHPRAIAFFEEALVMYRLIYITTQNHPDIAKTLSNLGLAHQAQGDNSRAIECYEAALAMNDLVYAKTPNHPNIAATLNNLGALYLAQGNHPRAIEYYEAALVIQRLAYATTPNHHDIAGSLNNLGSAYNAQGNLVRAIELCEESLAMYRLAYATTPNHPSLAVTLSNLGIFYQAQGNYRRAIECTEEYLVMLRFICSTSSDHIKIASTLLFLGILHEGNRDSSNADAKICFNEALSMLNTLGVSDTDPMVIYARTHLNSINCADRLGDCCAIVCCCPCGVVVSALRCCGFFTAAPDTSSGDKPRASELSPVTSPLLTEKPMER